MLEVEREHNFFVEGSCSCVVWGTPVAPGGCVAEDGVGGKEVVWEVGHCGFWV